MSVATIKEITLEMDGQLYRLRNGFMEHFVVEHPQPIEVAGFGGYRRHVQAGSSSYTLTAKFYECEVVDSSGSKEASEEDLVRLIRI